MTLKQFFNRPNLAILFLQLGLAFVFAYAAIASTLRPEDWVGYLPSFVKIISPYLLLKIFSLIELILAIWLVSSFQLFYASLFSTFVLIGITFTNLSIFDVTFRDVGLVLASIALTILSASKNK